MALAVISLLTSFDFSYVEEIAVKTILLPKTFWVCLFCLMCVVFGSCGPVIVVLI